MVPGEPTLQDMKKVVVVQQKRPFVSNRWSENSVSVSLDFIDSGFVDLNKVCGPLRKVISD